MFALVSTLPSVVLPFRFCSFGPLPFNVTVVVDFCFLVFVGGIRQQEDGNIPAHDSTVSYTIGLAGTGQPSISYPLLDFHPAAFYALGSPTGEWLNFPPSPNDWLLLISSYQNSKRFLFTLQLCSSRYAVSTA